MTDHDDLSEHDDVVQRLRTFGAQPIDPARQSADLTEMVAVRPLRSSRSRLKIAAAVLAGFALGSSGLAAADVLPDQAQHVAHTTLKRVGVDVPNPARYYEPTACGADEKKNHGAYVRDDNSLAGSDCGKPVQATDKGDQGTDEPTGDACQGRPAWAGDKSLTKEERKAQVAARAAECGDVEAPDVGDQTEVDSPSKPDESNTSVPGDEGADTAKDHRVDEAPPVTTP